MTEVWTIRVIIGKQLGEQVCAVHDAPSCQRELLYGSLLDFRLDMPFRVVSRRSRVAAPSRMCWGRMMCRLIAGILSHSGDILTAYQSPYDNNGLYAHAPPWYHQQSKI